MVTSSRSGRPTQYWIKLAYQGVFEHSSLILLTRIRANTSVLEGGEAFIAFSGRISFSTSVPFIILKIELNKLEK